MIITCDNCNTSFELDENLIKETGSKVRCTHCDHVFIAHPPTRPEESAGLEFIDPEEFALGPDEIDLTEKEAPAPEEEPELILRMAYEDEPGLALEMEPDDPPSKTGTAPADDSDALDLSDIEKMLEMDDAGDRGTKEHDTEEELELELAPSPGEKTGTAQDMPFEPADELDLSDIEKLLEMDDFSESNAAAVEEEELKLELDTGYEQSPETGKAGSIDEALSPDLELTPDEDLKLELEEPLDLSLELEEEDEPLEASASGPAGEMDEPEIFLDEPGIAEPVGKKVGPEPGRIEKSQPQANKFGMGKEQDTENEKVAPAKPSPVFVTSIPLPKRSRRLPVLLWVALLVLLGGGTGLYFYPNLAGKLPFLSSFFGGKAGDILPIEDTFKYRFVENIKTGSLFIITGDVENGFGHPRSNIQVAGELLAKDGKVIQSRTVYCGNVIQETDLANGEIPQINTRLSNPTGDNQSNLNVKPGTRVPFMIVFADLPDNIEEYRIHVAGSSPSKN